MLYGVLSRTVLNICLICQQSCEIKRFLNNKKKKSIPTCSHYTNI